LFTFRVLSLKRTGRERGFVRPGIHLLLDQRTVPSVLKTCTLAVALWLMKIVYCRRIDLSGLYPLTGASINNSATRGSGCKRYFMDRVTFVERPTQAGVRAILNVTVCDR